MTLEQVREALGGVSRRQALGGAFAGVAAAISSTPDAEAKKCKKKAKKCPRVDRCPRVACCSCSASGNNVACTKLAPDTGSNDTLTRCRAFCAEHGIDGGAGEGVSASDSGPGDTVLCDLTLGCARLPCPIV